MALTLLSRVKDILSYVYDLRAELAIIAILFTIFYIVGFFASLNYQGTQDTATPVSKDNDAYAESISIFSTIVGYIITNLVNSLITMICGLALGFVPVLFAITNGLTIGMFVGSTVQKTGIIVLLVAIVPYATFQIPAILLSSAIGLRLGYSLLKAFRGKKGMFVEAKKSFAAFTFLILPLTILAGIIQATISNPILMAL